MFWSFIRTSPSAPVPIVQSDERIGDDIEVHQYLAFFVSLTMSKLSKDITICHIFSCSCIKIYYGHRRVFPVNLYQFTVQLLAQISSLCFFSCSWCITLDHSNIRWFLLQTWLRLPCCLLCCVTADMEQSFCGPKWQFHVALVYHLLKTECYVLPVS